MSALAKAGQLAFYSLVLILCGLLYVCLVHIFDTGRGVLTVMLVSNAMLIRDSFNVTLGRQTEESKQALLVTSCVKRTRLVPELPRRQNRESCALYPTT
jgi:tetrahydromethanopterin S-methyltransferase subunit C